MYKTEAEASASTLSPTLLVSVYPHGAGVIILLVAIYFHGAGVMNLLVSVHPHTAGVMTLLVSVYPYGAGVSVSLCLPSYPPLYSTLD